MKIQKSLFKNFLLVVSSFLLVSISAFAQLVDQDVQTRDQVFIDDVIINGGSLCVGLDCVNGENFGFDTQRLKENNLRIHFNDTSNSASFPTNDWRIVINDSGNGGSSYFGVEDSDAGRIPFRVEAGAPVHTLYVESDGDVGIKTANPVVDLHIVEGNTPTVRLEQDGSDGFTPQTWDIAANETNFFIRDVTNGSLLPFRIKPAAPVNSIFIAANGDVGLGTPNSGPTHRLHVVGDVFISGELDAISDIRVKDNILPILEATETIGRLNAVQYNLRTNEYPELNLPTDNQFGLIAQEVELVLPELVNIPETDDAGGFRSVNYLQLIPILIKANQEQAQANQVQANEIESLKSAIQLLTERLDKLEK